VDSEEEFRNAISLYFGLKTQITLKSN